MYRLLLFWLFAVGSAVISHSLQAQQKQEVMIITTIEYMDFLDGGSSQMHISRADGSSESVQLRGLYSFGKYISDKKVKQNDQTLISKLNEYLQQGWQIVAVSSSTQPKGNSLEDPPSSILTRYVLVRDLKQ
ncbi:MAG: hypothetical protein RMJ44_08350 [Cytophagales bacterium]|nr:hypothetical protein [Bernardetiaceae bacterium]MDW8211083.1 hypothetical protein [Cytophagales bacterium]